MALFCFKAKDGTIYMRLTGAVNYEPSLSKNGKFVNFSMCYAKGQFMHIQAWSDSKTGDICARLEKGDVIAVDGIFSSREYNGKTYTQVLADFVTIQSEDGPMPMEQVPAEVPPPSPAAGGFNELMEEDDGDLPF